MDDSLFTSNSVANIFPYSFHLRKNNIPNGKIGSPFMIYVFYFKDYHLYSPPSRSYCSQVFSRTTALKAEKQPFTGIL